MTTVGFPSRRGRVGGSRLTPLGAGLIFLIVVATRSPFGAADRQILAILVLAMGAVITVGVAAPLLAVRRISVAASAPRDATVGDEVPVDVTLSGRFSSCAIRLLDPQSTWYLVSGLAATAGTAGTLQYRAERRGLFPAVTVEVRVTAPLGILAARRVHQVVLASPVAVAPKPATIDWHPAPAPLEGASDPVALAAVGGDLVRSVRPYVSGDPAHLVHWPSTARTGTLVVREMEPPSPLGQALVVDLRDLGVDTEAAASYAYGAARAVLAVGGELIMCTAEAEGPMTAPVRHPVDAGRRLARAVDGAPGVAPAGWPVVEIGR